MVCESCGEKPKNTAKDFTKAVIEINNPEALVLLRKVVIPASMGDEESVPPAIGKYRNVLLQYEANDHIYLYSSDGIPTAITANIPQEILDSIAELEATDVVLQQEIDDLKNSPDVVDIVPTYADLQAYDTSKLGDNDIIRVLQDEQHDGQSTYYRWNATTSSWTYIGAVGDYYTKGQVDTLLASKQNTLTAGANVQISPENVISATDTTYTHFTGATASTDGTAGLVPAPVAGDDTKFLSGDGTWGTPAGTTYTAGTNVQISAQNVISATDTTYSAFVGTDGQTAGTAGLVPAPATTDAGKFLKADGTWDTTGGGGDSVYSPKTTSNNSEGGAVYIGNKNANQEVQEDPTTSDQHYKYFWALPTGGSDANALIPKAGTIDILGDIESGNDYGVAIGYLSQLGLYAGGSVALGFQAKAKDNASGGIAIGQNVTVSGEHGIGIGGSITIGSSSSNCVAIGYAASCYSSNCVALGKGAYPTRQGEVNVGCDNTTAFNNTNYRVIGGVHDGQLAHDAATVGQLTAYSVVSGAGAPTTSTVAQYIGQFYYDTTNDGYYYCTAITAQGTTPETYSYTWTALSTGGSGPTVVQTTGTSQADVMSQNAVTSIVFADPATATRVSIGNANAGTSAVSVGQSAYGAGDYSVSLGFQSNTYGGSGAVAMGQSARARAVNAVSIGYNAGHGVSDNQYKGAISLGAYSQANAVGEMNIGSSDTTCGYNSSNYRLLTGVHDAQGDHDAVNLGQLNGRVKTNAGAPTTATVGAVGQLLEDTTNGKLYQCTAVDTTDPQNPSYTWTEVGAGGGGPTVVQTTGTSQTDVMSQNAATSMIWGDPSTKHRISIRSIGPDSSTGDYAVGIGDASTARGEGSISIGQAAANYASGVYSVAIGNSSRTDGHSRAVALGNASNAAYDNSVAIGTNAVTTAAGEVNIGAGTSGRGYNNTNYRTLSGLHDAQGDHDAVTLGQLNGRVTQNAGAPTTSTVGTVGQLLEDTTNGKLYICTDATNPYVWTEVGAGGGGTTEIEYVNCTLTGATATGFTLSADKTATQVKALVESGKEVIYKFVNSTSVGSVLAGTYEFSVLFAGTNTSVDVVTGYGMTSTYGSQTQDVYTFIHTSSAVDVTAGTIPTVNDATLTIQKNGTTVQTFTANASSNATANIEVPTITMTTTDPGEGSALAADNFVAVYGGDPIIMDYSTSEINTGATWINGKPIYKKTISTGALPNTTTKNVAHGISNLDLVIDIKGCAWDGSSTWLPIPNAGSSSATIEAYVYSSNIVIATGMDRTGFTTSYVTLYYTKSS